MRVILQQENGKFCSPHNFHARTNIPVIVQHHSKQNLCLFPHSLPLGASFMISERPQAELEGEVFLELLDCFAGRSKASDPDLLVSDLY